MEPTYTSSWSKGRCSTDKGGKNSELHGVNCNSDCFINVVDYRQVYFIVIITLTKRRGKVTQHACTLFYERFHAVKVEVMLLQDLRENGGSPF